MGIGIDNGHNRSLAIVRHDRGSCAAP